MYSIKVQSMDGVEDEAISCDRKDVETVRFSSGNPRVETTRGVVHLFRNTSSTPGSRVALPADRNEQLCVLAVPSHMSDADFCLFTGSFIQNITEMRIVRNDGLKDRYSVLIRLKDQDSADDFFGHFNGTPFSSLESEICHVLFTTHVQYTISEEQASNAPCGLTEIPTCPVCLERLDQHVSGILTTVCNHSFHSSCISKWTDSSCPVCRYCQQPYENSICSVCSTSENLWICVICGFVGCGRYEAGHAEMHWRETQHCYSLELESQRVWDYVGDNYVHRLIQSKTDGKLVELNGPCHEESECSGGTDFNAAILSSKTEATKYEYEHLLTAQLETQRQYYDGEKAILKTQLESQRQHYEGIIGERIEKAVNSKLHRLNDRLDKTEKERAFLEEMNKCLRDNQEEWKSKLKQIEEREKKCLEERDKKIQDLEEQVRDFMVFIEAQKTIECNGELREGSVFAAPRSSKPLGRRRKK